ncbi:MAG: ferritin-like domain-containing protein [Pseudanabaenaceae cyanobacterium SKYGB_i_bin29]|nr:ferritin-like domain-containing protein [Pseudanabaenaceae cyanobacterium SKYG29]MDW8421808.1 ferritin-like domain-containing protein [Pseudanabaenaceae cyanobacterium SKYGB_i_bin29]
MTVTYPRKFRNQLSAHDILSQVVKNRELHLVTLNRYRFNEQRSCKDLTNLIETLNGQPRELVKDLSHHIKDEANHAEWLTDLLYELGADLGTPPGVSYIDNFERLLGYSTISDKETGVIEALAAINVTEKRGCEYFSAHIKVLKENPSPENDKIRATIERIMPEEAAHVRWGNRKLAEIAKQSPAMKQKVEQAKQKYMAIEQAAYESGMDILAGAELRRIDHLLKIAETLPVWERPQYLLKSLPDALFDGELQKTRWELLQKAWQRDPAQFFQNLLPMFLSGQLSVRKSA